MIVGIMVGASILSLTISQGGFIDERESVLKGILILFLAI